MEVLLDDHVVLKGEKTGRVRYLGHLDGVGQPQCVFAGVALDAPGKCTVSVGQGRWTRRKAEGEGAVTGQKCAGEGMVCGAAGSRLFTCIIHVVCQRIAVCRQRASNR